MTNRTRVLGAFVAVFTALLPISAWAENFRGNMSPDQVTEADATSESEIGTCRSFNTSAYPVDSDAAGHASFQLITSADGPSIHFTVTVQQSAGVNDVFVAIGSPDDTWCDGRPRHYLYGGPGLGAPVAGVTNGLVNSGVLVPDNGTTSDLSEFASAPGAGDGFDNFVAALQNGNVFIVARVNSLGPYFRGEIRGQIEPTGTWMAGVTGDRISGTRTDLARPDRL